MTSFLPRTSPSDSSHRADQQPALSAEQIRAEAARFAVLCRVAPMLRHDMAGALQPLGMVAMVLQRRVQAPELDLQAIAKNAVSIGSLTKEATAGCMEAMGWLAPRGDPAVSLHSGVADVLQVLQVELSGSGLEAVNDLAEDQVTAPQSFFRTVLAAALLAFCDQGGGAGRLQIGLDDSQSGGGRTEPALRLAVASSGTPMTPTRRPRPVIWPDVQALAASWGVAMTTGDGWLTVALPKPSKASG